MEWEHSVDSDFGNKSTDREKLTVMVISLLLFLEEFIPATSDTVLYEKRLKKMVLASWEQFPNRTKNSCGSRDSHFQLSSGS